MTSEQRTLVESVVAETQLHVDASPFDSAVQKRHKARAAALTAALGTCGSCAHSDAGASPDNTAVFCTLRRGFYNGKLMQATSRCESWEQAPAEREPAKGERYCATCHAWVRAYECCGAGTRPQSRGGAR